MLLTSILAITVSCLYGVERRDSKGILKVPQGVTCVIDWRDSLDCDIPVRDQITLDSDDCGHFAVNGMLEYHIAIHEGRCEDLSEQQIHNCIDNSQIFEEILDLFVFPGGAIREDDLPYGDTTKTCEEAMDYNITGAIDGYITIPWDNNRVDAIKAALETGPVVAVIGYPPSFENYGDGIYCPVETCEYNQDTNHCHYSFETIHAIVIVGWGENTVHQTVWIIRNSWGTGWGIDGYGYVLEDDLNMQEPTEIFYHVVGSHPEVVLPNGGERWAHGSEHMVRWTCEESNIDSFDVSVFYSENDAEYINDHVSGEEREISWVIPNILSDECLVRVIAYTSSYDENVITNSDTSDAYFSIIDPMTEWDIDGLAVCEDPADEQISSSVVSDGLKGAIIIGVDSPADNGEICAQRVNAYGDTLWTNTRISVGSNTAEVLSPVAVSDKEGGAIVAWEDLRAGTGDRNIYAQRIGPDGEVLWSPDGIAICTASGDQFFEEIIKDGNGGAIIEWMYASGNDYKVCLQHVTGDGDTTWGQNGLEVPASGNIRSWVLTPDGSGGAFVAWIDDSNTLLAQRANNGAWMWGQPRMICQDIVNFMVIDNDGAGNMLIAWVNGYEGEDIYAWKFDGNGDSLWAENVPICTADGFKIGLKLKSDGTGGAYIGWNNLEDPYCNENCEFSVYSQRVDNYGDTQWATNGIELASGWKYASNDFPAPIQITHDGDGGAIMIWLDSREGQSTGYYSIDNWDIYTQRISSDGVLQWHASGEPICANFSNLGRFFIDAEHDGSIIIAWTDYSIEGSCRIRTQKLLGNYSSSGTPGCSISAKITVTEGENIQEYCPPSSYYLVGCPAGDFNPSYKLVTTIDFDDADMAGQTIDPGDFTLDTTNLGFSFCDIGNEDLAGTAENGYTVTLVRKHIKGCSGCEGSGCSGDQVGPKDVTIIYNGFNLGEISDLKVKSPDNNEDMFVNLNDLSTFGQTCNKVLGQTGYNSCFDFNLDDKINLSDYAFMGEHYQCACPVSSNRPVFSQLISDTKVRMIVGNPDQDGKVKVDVFLDNLDNASTLAMSINDEISDLRYIGWTSDAGFKGVPAIAQIDRNGEKEIFITLFGLEELSGSSIMVGTLEYAVSEDLLGASDLGSNRLFDDKISIKFGEIMENGGDVKVLSITSVQENIPVYSNHLGGNYPNPFNPSTTIVFSIASDMYVNLSIYNVAGQLIRTIVNENLPRNEHRVVWDGKNNEGSNMSSGIYFYKIKTKEFSATKKMVLLR